MRMHEILGVEQKQKLKALYDFGMRWLFWDWRFGKPQAKFTATINRPVVMEYNSSGVEWDWVGGSLKIHACGLFELAEPYALEPLDIVQTLRDAGVEV